MPWIQGRNFFVATYATAIAPQTGAVQKTNSLRASSAQPTQEITFRNPSTLPYMVNLHGLLSGVPAGLSYPGGVRVWQTGFFRIASNTTQTPGAPLTYIQPSGEVLECPRVEDLGARGGKHGNHLIT